MQRNELNVVVYSNGLVSWVPVYNLESDCAMDLTYFPFDTQNCSIKVGSWTYDGWQVQSYLF